MRHGLSRSFVILLVISLLAIPSFAQINSTAPSVSDQTPADSAAQKKAAAEAKKLEDQRKKDEEKKRKEDEKLAKEAKKRKNSDIENIGNRDINKGGFHPMTMNLEKEIALGRQLASEFESQVTLIQDPVITEYVNRVGQNLVKNSDSKIP